MVAEIRRFTSRKKPGFPGFFMQYHGVHDVLHAHPGPAALFVIRPTDFCR
jgi:hypothetical protein